MTDTMERHYVTFFSPGTFVHETTTREVLVWDVEMARALAEGIVERHGATPFGFQFTTRRRGPEDFDSKETAKSPFYYLHAKIETLADVKARNDPREDILIRNMEGNGWDRVVTTTKGWKWTQPLRPDDVVL